MDDKKLQEAEKRITVLETAVVNLINTVSTTQESVRNLTAKVNELSKGKEENDGI